MSVYEDVIYEVQDGVGVVTLNRPQALNAYTVAMGESLKRAVADAVADDAVRVIVLTGAGRGFCAGADMSRLQKITPGGERVTGTPDTNHDLYSGLGPDVGPHYRSRFGYLLQARKPVIAALNGPAAGLGLVAEHGVSWLLPRLIGPAHALDLLLSARKLGAAEAERIGLVNKVLPQATFMPEVMAYARTLAQTVSPRSTAVIKAQVWKALCQDFNEALALADGEMHKSFASADFREGIAHYVEKRPPAFTGA